MLIPIAHAVAAYLYRDKSWAGPVLWAGQAATGVMLVSSLATALEGFDTAIVGRPLNLYLAGFFAEAAVYFLLTAVLHRRAGGVYLATVTACAAIWQVLQYAAVADEYYAIAFAVLGLIFLIGYRLSAAAGGGRGKAAFDCANGLLSVAFVAAVLLGLRRLAFHDVQWLFVGVCVTLTIVSILAAVLVRHAAWRRWYVVMAVAQGLLTLLAVQALSTLTGWQKAELFCRGGRDRPAGARPSRLAPRERAGRRPGQLWSRAGQPAGRRGADDRRALPPLGPGILLAGRAGPAGRRVGPAGERLRACRSNRRRWPGRR